jgi:hypothetical protein
MKNKTEILPAPRGNVQPSAPSPWIVTPSSQDDYPGALPRDRDPRLALGEGNILTLEPHPGSGYVTDPWRSAAAPSPRRLRRDG